MSIFQALSNLNHDGNVYIKGSVFEAEGVQFEQLVKEKVLKIVEGARDLAHAAEIVASQIEAEIAATEQAEKKPENTWEAKPDPKPEDANKPADTTQTNTAGPTDQTNQSAPVVAPEDANKPAGPVDIDAGLNL